MLNAHIRSRPCAAIMTLEIPCHVAFTLMKYSAIILSDYKKYKNDNNKIQESYVDRY